MTNRQLIRSAAEIVHRGGIIAYPTEAVFGLGCDPADPAAVERLLNLKQRSLRHGLILVAERFDQLAGYIATLPAKIEARMRATWPGPQTWVVPASAACPLWVSGEHDTVAVRISAHPVVQALCASAGMAIVSTSANRRGRPPARSALACRLRFGSDIDLVVPGATGGQARPTAIREAISGKLIRASGDNEQQ